MTRRIKLLSLLFMSIAFPACSTPIEPKEAEACERQVLTAAVISTALINPAENGDARPVQLRLYQLKNDVAFRNASFDDVWKLDQEKLAGDLLDRQEFPVYPDARREVDFERNPEAQFIVAAALFRTPHGKQWFATFELPPAPGAEACGAKCVDGDCAEPAEFNPKVYIRVDGTRVTDGSDWADYYPKTRIVTAEANKSL